MRCATQTLNGTGVVDFRSQCCEWILWATLECHALNWIFCRFGAVSSWSTNGCTTLKGGEACKWLTTDLFSSKTGMSLECTLSPCHPTKMVTQSLFLPGSNQGPGRPVSTSINTSPVARRDFRWKHWISRDQPPLSSKASTSLYGRRPQALQ